MFTGIIEELGIVRGLKKSRRGALRLEVQAAKILKGLKIGGSVAVNGACLTAVHKSSRSVSFDVISETLRRTALGKLQTGDRVNLERPVRAGDRFEGHFVLGHVDGVGCIRSLKATKGQTSLEVRFPKRLYPYLVEKGSVTLEGVSLTLGKVAQSAFWVHCIPHTLKETTLGQMTPGSCVNLEADILLKALLSIDKA